MELLILKTDQRYLRIVDNGYESCGIDKASVFPLSQLEQVKKHQQAAGQAGVESVSLYKLVLIEEPFVESEES